MPRRHRPASVCSEPGCPNRMPCATHVKVPWAGSDRQARLPGNWSTIRRRVLERDGYECQLCGAPADEVDHIRNNDDHSLANLWTLCEPHHKAKTAREAAIGRKRPHA
jgi:5-methylcytosine-specific restriction enzyme A